MPSCGIKQRSEVLAALYESDTLNIVINRPYVGKDSTNLIPSVYLPVQIQALSQPDNLARDRGLPFLRCVENASRAWESRGGKKEYLYQPTGLEWPKRKGSRGNGRAMAKINHIGHQNGF